jgi:hypothetical protein
MSRLYVFADEAGDFAFKRGPNVPRFFIVCTVATRSCAASEPILELRRTLAWEQAPINQYFHCSEDAQAVRDRVFEVVRKQDFEIQATIMEKSKAQPQVRSTNQRFYKYGWFYHFGHALRSKLQAHNELQVTVASIGTKRGQRVFTHAVNDVITQYIHRDKWKTGFWPCSTDPLLQLTDYCTWAIQKKWERDDTRSYDLIKDRITYEYELWRHGNHHDY